jgi:hypothetical protein
MTRLDLAYNLGDVKTPVMMGLIEREEQCLQENSQRSQLM